MGVIDASLWLTPLTYVLITLTLNYVLSKGGVFLPIIFHLLMLYLSYDMQKGLCAGYLHVLLLGMTFWNWCYKSRTAKVSTYTQWYNAVSTPSVSKVNVNLMISLSTIIALFAVVSLSSPDVAARLSSCIPIVIVIIAGTQIPGVSGNSTAGIVGIIVLIMFGILSLPQFTNLLFTYLESKLAPSTHQASTVHVGHVLHDWLISPSVTDVLQLGINLNNFPDLLRYLLGYTFTWYLVFDELLGPAEMISGAADGSQRKTACEKTSFTAGFYNSSWIFTGFGNVVFLMVTSGVSGLAMCITAVAPGYYMYRYFGRLVWNGRGQAASLTSLRDGFMFTFGTGVTGARKLMVGLITSICIVLLSQRHGVQVTVALIVLQALVAKSERYSVMLMGILSYNAGMLMNSFMTPSPLSGTIEATSINAYSPTVGGNASEVCEPVKEHPPVQVVFAPPPVQPPVTIPPEAPPSGLFGIFR
ncbi:VP3 [Inopus flavus jingmenvirus 1]|nr:VP3 [Inopus flavus jingmenvirus 1]